jgi:hypothetical protein
LAGGFLAGGALLFIAGGVGGFFLGRLSKDSQAATIRPEEQVARKDARPQGPARVYTPVNFGDVYDAYRQNEAAADAKYLNKPLHFTFIAQGIEKDSSATGPRPATSAGTSCP